MACSRIRSFVFFFNDTATTEIYTLSLHDALPISAQSARAIVKVLLTRGAAASRGYGASGSETPTRSEEHTSELQSRLHLVCRLLLEKKKCVQCRLIAAEPPNNYSQCNTTRNRPGA